MELEDDSSSGLESRMSGKEFGGRGPKHRDEDEGSKAQFQATTEGFSSGDSSNKEDPDDPLLPPCSTSDADSQVIATDVKGSDKDEGSKAQFPATTEGFPLGPCFRMAGAWAWLWTAGAWAWWWMAGPWAWLWMAGACAWWCHISMKGDSARDSSANRHFEDLNDPLLPPSSTSDADSQVVATDVKNKDEGSTALYPATTEGFCLGPCSWMGVACAWCCHTSMKEVSAEDSSANLHVEHPNDPLLPPSSTSDADSQVIAPDVKDKDEGSKAQFHATTEGFSTEDSSNDEHPDDPLLPSLSTSDADSQVIATDVKDKDEGSKAQFHATTEGFSTGDSSNDEDPDDPLLPPPSTSDADSQVIATDVKDNDEGSKAQFPDETEGVSTGDSSANLYVEDPKDPVLPPSSTSDADSQVIAPDVKENIENVTFNPPHKTEEVDAGDSSAIFDSEDQKDPLLPQSFTCDTDNQENTADIKDKNEGSKAQFHATTEGFSAGDSSANLHVEDPNDPLLPPSSTSDADSQVIATDVKDKDEGSKTQFHATTEGVSAGDSSANLHVEHPDDPLLPPSSTSDADSQLIATDVKDKDEGSTARFPATTEGFSLGPWSWMTETWSWWWMAVAWAWLWIAVTWAWWWMAGAFACAWWYHTSMKGKSTGDSSANLHVEDSKDPVLPPSSTNDADSQNISTVVKENIENVTFNPPNKTEEVDAGDSSANFDSEDQKDPLLPQSFTCDTVNQENTADIKDKDEGSKAQFHATTEGFSTGDSSANLHVEDPNDPLLPPSSTSDADNQVIATDVKDKDEGSKAQFHATTEGFSAGDSSANLHVEDPDDPLLPPSSTSDADSQVIATDVKDEDEGSKAQFHATTEGFSSGDSSNVEHPDDPLLPPSSTSDADSQVITTDVKDKDEDLNDPLLPPSSTSDADSQVIATNVKNKDEGSKAQFHATTEGVSAGDSSANLHVEDPNNPLLPPSSTSDADSQVIATDVKDDDEGSKAQFQATTEGFSSGDSSNVEHPDDPLLPPCSTSDADSQVIATDVKGSDKDEGSKAQFPATTEGFPLGPWWWMAGPWAWLWMAGACAWWCHISMKETNLMTVMKDLGLERHSKEKLSLSKILQIDDKTLNEEPDKSKSDLPWYFMKKLMMVNVTARNIKHVKQLRSNSDDASKTTDIDYEDMLEISNSEDMVNPLDVITALFLCSDGFVQQEMALKMSMCQFSVPLLLPNCDSQQCTLMLWAMRDIVKQYRPEALSESKGFTEERIVLSNLPMISFVRLGECSLSKSETLNKLLSNSQQYHDIFVHRNMECGNSPRRISNGLTEITWYLPCGNKNIDIFSQPVAVANLRGDIKSFETQYAFLCQTSAAVFVFLDKLDAKCTSNLLSTRTHKAQTFLVFNNNKQINVRTLKEVSRKLGLTKNNIIIRNKNVNDVDVVNFLREEVSDMMSKTDRKMSIEEMADVAHELGIWVDEDSPECQRAKKHADAITADIKDPLTFKEQQLPLQGQIWKELTSLEKEEFRLRKLGSENIETYKSDLKEKKNRLRQKQNSTNMSNTLSCFINALSLQQKERSYFLKWMRINLDNMSCIKLSGLRKLYKEKWKSSENKEEIKQLDRHLTSSSLGTEHFFREMGQIYEASRFLPETDQSRKQLNHLPGLCAQLLLDGFPLELVDGDASNIPLQWVSDVLSQLNEMVSPKNKILVVTVLGVKSTGKSTLLNTMFGVQFAVSSGRCIRGAFMLLIKVHEEFKTELNCDFIVIIDTEGLKSPDHAQLDNSYEHDNELATLVVGLSDLTIVNIAMENLSEMKDILQIVVHAFLRMKEVGKKPKCHFVHQNVSDMSAHEKNLRDRNLLLQQLDEMTQAAARMEKEFKSFTDVMEYNPDTGNCYIPGFWNGNPPMAPVNVGYSEAVYELKKHIIKLLQKCRSSDNDIINFKDGIKSLWNAVKHENLIFSFRNSLVADAYMRLCTEFNKWEWEFRKEMYIWGTNAETKISNFGNVYSEGQTSVRNELLLSLKTEAITVLCQWEKKLLENLTKYFTQTERHVHLVEGHRAEFENSAQGLRWELENSVLHQLSAAANIKQGMVEIDRIKKNHTKEIKKAVCALIDECRKTKHQMTDQQQDKEFDKMWKETLETFTYSEQKPIDVFNKVSYCLRTNLLNKGSHANELFGQKRLQDCGREPFIYKPEKTFRKITHKVNTWLNMQYHIPAIQQRADSIIAVCTMSINEKMAKKSYYHDAYIQEILNIIDERLQNDKDVQTDIEFEVNLKQHICGFAARKFQELHQSFLQTNDPYRCLMKNKKKFCADFKDVFHKRDQCQKKAEEFANQCLKPAVEDRVNRVLGLNITDEMLTCQEFSTRINFQYSILLDLLSRKDFLEYHVYNTEYEHYVKSWILQQIEKHFSTCSKLSEFEDQLLESIISSIEDAIKNVSNNKNENVKSFVENICRELEAKLVISQDALGAFMILNNANQEQFADSLTKCLKDMKRDLKDKFQKTNIQTKLKNLHMKPQNELFTRVIGCGKQCPFCATPCDAGGKAHTEHWASLHRPQGLGKYRWNVTAKLETDICSSSVISDRTFSCHQTNNKYHPYKDYKQIFADWKISPDLSLEASDYWKYVMTTYNQDFAELYNVKPAEIPQTWKCISYKQAEESLKELFRLKDPNLQPQRKTTL
ncbi:interferon-induced very large GTPase 1-like isoform X1 [Gouania willdenowi]|uniref:interferon-induced very large GTPase 1-like isoform X1 n=1 Tax=Gouania willdenowi TaxID=441366 RepID=UPI00105530E5|nr:interferon-induced very large GTPase 1-like isoform X1 [Gouania willdenowi]